MNRSRWRLGCGLGWDHGTAYLVGTGSPPPKKRGNLGASPYKYRECNYYDCGEYVKLIRYVAALQRCGLSLSVLQQLVITIKAQDRRSGRWKWSRGAGDGRVCRTGRRTSSRHSCSRDRCDPSPSGNTRSSPRTTSP